MTRTLQAYNSHVANVSPLETAKRYIFCTRGTLRVGRHGAGCPQHATSKRRSNAGLEDLGQPGGNAAVQAA